MALLPLFYRWGNSDSASFTDLPSCRVNMGPSQDWSPGLFLSWPERAFTPVCAWSLPYFSIHKKKGETQRKKTCTTSNIQTKTAETFSHGAGLSAEQVLLPARGTSPASLRATVWASHLRGTMLHISIVLFLMEMVCCKILKRAITRKKVIHILHKNVQFLTTPSVILLLKTRWAGINCPHFHWAEGSRHSCVRAQRKKIKSESLS